MKVVLDKGAILPTRAHAWDAGLDLYAPKEVLVPPVGAKVINNHIYASHTVGSSTIDTGVHNNHSDKAQRFMAGDKIAQLVIVPCLLPDLEQVDYLEETDRGNKGFGSTGR